jgi:transposase
MKKRIYRRTPVKQFDAATIRPEDVGSRLVVAVDVAKVDMVAALVAADGTVLKTICWEAPAENVVVIELLRLLRTRGFDIEVVMEPSGTYGDVLRQMLEDAGLPLFHVQGKKTHDASELYDGVPSMHDAKAAAVIAKLHREGLSRRLAPEPLEKRVLRAAIAIVDLHQTRYLCTGSA